MLQGKYLATSLNNIASGGPVEYYHFKSPGSLAYVGEETAVGVLGLS